MKMNNIIVTGCSYSTKAGVLNPYPLLLKNYFNGEVINLAWPGQSNDTIIRNVKEEIRKGTTNTFFICQLTHLHRMAKFCSLNQKWVDFQPAIANPTPDLKDSEMRFDIKIFDVDAKSKTASAYDGNIHGVSVYGATKPDDIAIEEFEMWKLINWYQDYLMYIYDEENEFKELHYKLSELTTLVENNGNEILYLYWPDTISDKSLFKNNNFLSINGEYSLMRWSIKNNLTQRHDTHLTSIGHVRLLNELSRYIKLDKFDKNKLINQFLL